jgi:hypothetical protein
MMKARGAHSYTSLSLAGAADEAGFTNNPPVMQAAVMAGVDVVGGRSQQPDAWDAAVARLLHDFMR